MKDLPFVLRVLAGATPGVEFPLKAFANEIVVGRSDEADLVLDDAQVSRKHARLYAEQGKLCVQDLGSTNGVFVNARRVQGPASLKEGDRIQFGASLLKLGLPVKANPARDASTTMIAPEEEAAPAAAEPAASRKEPSRFSGAIDEIPLPDVMQVLATGKKSGVLSIQSVQGFGSMTLRGGKIVFAMIGRPPSVFGPKAVYRMAAWQAGSFEFRPAEDQKFEEEIDESTEALLLEAMRQVDEIARLQTFVPARSAKLIVARGAPAPASLPAEQAQVLGVIAKSPKLTVGTLLDSSPLPDLETYQALVDLTRAGHVVAASEW